MSGVWQETEPACLILRLLNWYKNKMNLKSVPAVNRYYKQDVYILMQDENTLLDIRPNELFLKRTLSFERFTYIFTNLSLILLGKIIFLFSKSQFVFRVLFLLEHLRYKSWEVIIPFKILNGSKYLSKYWGHNTFQSFERSSPSSSSCRAASTDIPDPL